MANPLELDPLFLSSKELMALEMDEVKFLLDPFMPVGGITMLHGKFGTYKTPLLLNICKALASGEELWGLEVAKASPLLFLEIDSPPSVIVPRMRAVDFSGLDVDFCLGHPGFDAAPAPGRVPSKRSKALIDRLRHQHEQRGYKAVFIDSLRMLHTLQDKDSDAPPRVYGALGDLFFGAALVIVHHDRKEPPSSRDRAAREASDEKFSGSQAWANHAQVVISVAHGVKATGDILLSHTKSQAGPRLSSLALRVQDGTHIRLRNELDMESIDGWMQMIKKEALPAVEQDQKLAQYASLTARTAKRKRLLWEKWSKERGPKHEISCGPSSESAK